MSSNKQDGIEDWSGLEREGFFSSRLSRGDFLAIRFLSFVFSFYRRSKKPDELIVLSSIHFTFFSKAGGQIQVFLLRPEFVFELKKARARACAP